MGLAEQAERYDEMAEHMKEVGKIPQELSVEERNLLSVACKNTVGSRRAAWRIITSIEQKEKSKGNNDQAAFAREYCVKVEAELDAICSQILELLNGNLLEKASTDESKVFYHKMKADYYRYIAEFKVEGEKTAAAENARKIRICMSSSCQERPAPRYWARCPADLPLRLHSPFKPINTCSLDKKRHHITFKSTIRKIQTSKSKNFEIREIRICTSRETGSTLLAH